MLKRLSQTTGASLFLFFLFLSSHAVFGSENFSVSLASKDRVLVLAPHPDDETLGAGGVIQEAVGMKIPVKIVFYSYGDSNEWSFLLYRRHFVVIPKAVETMGLVRHDEAVNAARILGVDAKDLIFLGYPDFGGLNIWYYHWNDRSAYGSFFTHVKAVPYASAYRPGAPYKGEEIVSDLRSILRAFKPSKIFVSHPADHNGDHLALYLYLRVALWDEGFDDKVLLYPYLIHYLGWPKPKGFHPQMNATPPEDYALRCNWASYHLSPSQFTAKLEALRAHVSQYKSSPAYLLSFVKNNELFGDFPPVVAPLNKTVPIVPAQKKTMQPAVLPGDLNDRQRLAFIGVDWKFVRWEKDRIVISIKLSQPLAQDVNASIYLFGYHDKIPFERMPKINVRLGLLSYNVYDQNKRLNQGLIRVERKINQLTLLVPMKLLGFPQKILTSARTSVGHFPLDTACWVVVERS